MAYQRTEKESSKAFEAFEYYLHLGTGRSLVKVGEHFGKSRQFIEGWSSTHNWVARVRQHENDLALERQEQLRRAAEEANMRHIEQGKALIGKGLTALNELDRANLLKLSPTEILRFITEGTRLERDALGIPNRIDMTTDGKEVTSMPSAITVEIVHATKDQALDSDTDKGD